MVTKKVCTFIRPDSTVKGFLRGRYNIAVWDFDGDRFSNSRWDHIMVAHEVPTALSRSHDVGSLEAAVQQYTDELRRWHRDQIERLAVELEELNEGTKAYEEKDRVLRRWTASCAWLDRDVGLRGPFATGRYSTYVVKTPPFSSDARKVLGDLFIGRVSPIEHARRVLDYPYCVVESLFDDGQLSVEEMMKVSILAADFETQEWQKVECPWLYDLGELTLREHCRSVAAAHGEPIPEEVLGEMHRRDFIYCIEDVLDRNKNERLTVSAICDMENHNYLVTTIDCGEPEIHVEIPGTGRAMKVNVLFVKDQDELVEMHNTLVEQVDPVVFGGHFMTHFDHGKGRELAERRRAGDKGAPEFLPGVGGTRPINLGRVGDFANHFVCPGRDNIDAARYAQLYMYTHNNKLDTIFRHLVGVHEGKTIATHDELAVLTSRAEQGDVRAAHEILYYAAQDAFKSQLMSRALLHEHVLLSKMFRSTFSRVGCASRRNQSSNYWDRWTWKHKHTVPSVDFKACRAGSRKFENFDSVGHMHHLLRAEELDLRGRKGLVQGYLVSFHPFVRAFEPMLRRDADVDAVYRAADASAPKKQYRLMLALEALAEYPLFKSLDPFFDQRPSIYAAEFQLGFEGVPLEEYRARVQGQVRQVADLVERAGIINSKGRFFVLEDLPDNLEGICDSMVIHGEGLFLSGTKGRFAASIDDEFHLFGIASPMSKKGERCPYEQSFADNFLRLATSGDVRGAVEYMVDRVRLLNDGLLTRGEVVYDRTARRDFDAYRDGATQPYITRMVEQRIREGQRLQYEYGLGEMRSKFFGVEPPSGLFGEPEVRDGSLSSMVKWMFPMKSAVPLLYEIFLGKGTKGHVDKLVNMFEEQKYI